MPRSDALGVIKYIGKGFYNTRYGPKQRAFIERAIEQSSPTGDLVRNRTPTEVLGYAIFHALFGGMRPIERRLTTGTVEAYISGLMGVTIPDYFAKVYGSEAKVRLDEALTANYGSNWRTEVVGKLQTTGARLSEADWLLLGIIMREKVEKGKRGKVKHRLISYADLPHILERKMR